jgi:hypothetical protein
VESQPGFSSFTDPIPRERWEAALGEIAERGLEAKLAEVVGALAEGEPSAAEAAVLALAEEAGTGVPEVYWLAVATRCRRSDVAEVLAAVEVSVERGDDPADLEPELERLAAILLPFTGLDLAEALRNAHLFVVNFPLPGRVLDDVDERAARWLAQLLDTSTIRRRLRHLLSCLAEVWERDRPAAAAVVRSRSAGDPPADPTLDRPWMGAMLDLARSQL